MIHGPLAEFGCPVFLQIISFCWHVTTVLLTAQAAFTPGWGGTAVTRAYGPPNGTDSPSGPLWAKSARGGRQEAMDSDSGRSYKF